MGPIERELVMRYDAIEHRLKIPPPTPRQIPTINKENELIAEIVALKAELAEAHERIRRIRGYYTHSQTINNIISIVSKDYVMEVKELLSNRREANILLARHIIYYLSAKNTNYSLPAIGKHLCRDHTTIMHGRNKIAKMRLKDPDLDNQLKTYEAQLGTPI